MDLSTKDVIKGVNHETVIDSKINIFIDAAGRITKVEDRWDGKLPEGMFSKTWRESNSVVRIRHGWGSLVAVGTT